MKSILLLSLLIVTVFSAEEPAPTEASNDIIDIVKCFLGMEELITDVKDIIEIIKSGDYSKLITIALKVYADVSNAVKDCVPQEETQLTVKFREKIFKLYDCIKSCGCRIFDKSTARCHDKCELTYGGMSKEEFNKRECARDCKYNKKHDEKCHCEEKKPITKEKKETKL